MGRDQRRDPAAAAGIAGTPYVIDVSAAVLDDLRARLERTRLPRAPEGPAWSPGSSLPFMRRLRDYWLDEYDWRAVEARLNRIPQRRFTVGGLVTHVFVEEGSGPAPTPLLLGHGWPGSPIELMNLVEPLAHPERWGGDVADAFTVIVPSLPGCGWSEPPAGPVSPREVASAWAELMRDALGFDNYLVHGGDWGAVIGSWMAADRAPGMAGLHLGTATLSIPVDQLTTPLAPEESAYLDRRAARSPADSAYQAVHGGKPLSIAYAHADSPIGLAAWIVEKLQAWTFPGQDVDPPFELEEIVSNVMFYWLGDAQAVGWLYRYLIDGSAFRISERERVVLPTGVCLFPADIASPPPDAWISRAYNLVHSTRAPSGGHFPGLENPRILIDDIRAFRRRLAAAGTREGGTEG